MNHQRATAATFALCILLLAGALENRALRAASPQRPNVIVVLTDDQGYGDLGCHGNKVLKTPCLDRLYADSIRLTDFHVAPVCAPTRAALMTGRHNLRSGVWSTVLGRSLLRRDEVTLADVFSANGYRTGFFGKWHLGDNYPYRPEDRGFQVVLRHGGGGVGQTPDYWGNSYFDDTYFHNGKPRKCAGYCTDVWFAEALAFIENNKERPFFAYLSTNSPHAPLHVPEKYAAPYQGVRGIDPRTARFFGMIANIDDNVGRLLDRLAELRLEDNTLVIFLTDNGGTAGVSVHNAGMRGAKGDYHDGGHRVPCFCRWPKGGLQGGRDVGMLSAHFDLLPTLVELCSLTPPKTLPLDGVSLAPALAGKADPALERTLVVQFSQTETPPIKGQGAVLTQRWRLVNGRELFDMREDPFQKHNVAAKHPDVVRKLVEEYDKWWAEVSKRFGEECPIVLGSDRENPTALSAMDWHQARGLPPWNQPHVRQGMRSNGYWSVAVERAGEYEIALRRWPIEMDQPIAAAGKDGKALPAAKARLRIAGTDRTQDLVAETRAATFKIKLPAGPARLETWFLDAKGEELCGAYYVYVKRL